MFNSMENARIAAVMLALVLGTAGCASTPDYVAAGDADEYGYYSTQLADNRYRVVYNGNDRIDLNRTKDYALFRAAELTLREGYTWFEVVDRATTTVERDGAGPHTGITHERTYSVERNCGLLGCTERVRPETRTGVHVDTRASRTRHSFALEVLMGNGEMPQKGGDFYAAEPLVNTIWERL